MTITRYLRSIICGLVLGAFAAAAVAEGVPAAMRPDFVPLVAQTTPPPLYLAKNLGLEPVQRMERADKAVPAELDAIAEWNAAGRLPTKIGFFRSVAVPPQVRLDAESLDKDLDAVGRGAVRKTGSGWVWAARIEVAGAWGLRARLADVRLPAGSQLWVYGEGGDSMLFGSELIRPDGDLWTPAVGGEVLSLEILVPHESLSAGEVLSFELDKVAQMVRLDEAGAPLLKEADPQKFCTESAACYTHPDPVFDIMKRATAHLQTILGNGVGICSGTLMNDTVDGGFIPYLLTANHCLDNQNNATSTSFYFDFIPSSCGGSDPFLFNLPRVDGATLLATRPASDSSFLRLFTSPGGSRGYAGSSITPPAIGELLQSFSHPDGRSMRYSSTFVLNQAGCGLSGNEYLFSDQDVGGVQGGSSGSHVFNENFRVVGQLFGACGSDPSNGCFFDENDRVDGRLSRFFDSIRQWLTPDQPGGCVENETTMCLNGDRFEVTATYTSLNDSGVGQAVELTDDTGYFWFFNSDNVEVVIKVLRACGFNNHYWVFAGGLTDLGIGLVVRDTQTGNVWSGANSLGQAFRTITDTGALTCN